MESVLTVLLEGIGNRDLDLATKHMHIATNTQLSPRALNAIDEVKGLIYQILGEEIPLKTHYVDFSLLNFFFDILKIENSYESCHTNTDRLTERKVFRNTYRKEFIAIDFCNGVFIPRGYHKILQSVARDRYVRHGCFGGNRDA
jgi:hypothetical protein